MIKMFWFFAKESIEIQVKPCIFFDRAQAKINTVKYVKSNG